MAEHETILSAEPGGELAHAIEEALARPVRIELAGALYRLHVDRESVGALPSSYNPEAARAAIERFSGSWAGVDADKLIAEIYRRREAGSRPSDRP
jgi:hypothetical protein